MGIFDNRTAWTVVALSAVTLCSLLLVRLQGDSDKIAETGEAVSSIRQEISAESQNAEKYAYIVKEYKGHIAAFTADSEEPVMTWDTPVRFLPEYDRRLLKEGIPVKDYAELTALIEDYIS